MSAVRWRHALFGAWRRELRLGARRRGELALPLLFCGTVASLLPLALAGSPALLVRVAPAGLWLVALLSMLLSLERLFVTDYADGTLEQWALSGAPLWLPLAGKLGGHWLLTGLPLALFAPVCGATYQLPPAALLALAASLLLGAPALTALGALAAALTVSLRGHALLPLLVLPLALPLLLFGAAAVDAAVVGLSPAPYFALLAAASLLAALTTPWLCAQALRIALE